MRIAFLVRINPFEPPIVALDAQIAEIKNNPNVMSAEKVVNDPWWNCRVVSKETRESKPDMSEQLRLCKEIREKFPAIHIQDIYAILEAP